MDHTCLDSSITLQKDTSILHRNYLPHFETNVVHIKICKYVLKNTWYVQCSSTKPVCNAEWIIIV